MAHSNEDPVNPDCSKKRDFKGKLLKLIGAISFCKNQEISAIAPIHQIS